MFEKESLKDKEVYISPTYPYRIDHRQLYARDKNHIPFHQHQSFQLIWCYKGEMTYDLMEECVAISSQQLLFLNSGQVHASKPKTSQASYLLVEFSEKMIDPYIFQNLIRPGLDPATKGTNILAIDPSLTLEFYKLLDLQPGPSLDWQVKILLNLFFNWYLRQEKQKGKLKEKNRDKLAFEQMLTFIEENYRQKIYLEDIAQAGHLNTSGCNSLFKRFSKLSPVTYLNQYRLYQAKKLLEQKEWAVEFIAYQVGFNHVSHFIRKFKQSYGLTPLQYRKKNQKT